MKSRIIITAVLLAAMGLLGGCVTNEATGRNQLDVLPESQELALGLQAQPQFLKEYGGELPDQQVVQYVRDLGKRLAAESERPDLPWEFHVTDSAVINAFALPGGKVFITRGLLSQLSNEAQLAGVLGHEVGHVTAKHISEQMGQQLVLQGALAGIGAASQASDEDWMRVMGVGASAGGSVYLLKFGRGQESEADKLGVRYMAKLGYNPVAQIQVMKVLKKAGGGGGPEWLATHPNPDTRIDDLKKLIPQQFPNYKKPGAFRFNQDEFQAAALDRLKNLPPPKHNPK